MPKAAAVSAPHGYQWAEVWPEPRRAGWVVGGAALFALAVVGGVWLDMPVSAVFFFALCGALAAVGGRFPRRPAVTIQDGRAVLNFRPWSSPVALGTCVIAALCVTLIWGVPSRLPESVSRASGIIVLVVVAPVLLSMLVGRNRLIFGEHGLRLVVRRLGRDFDREFPWNAMTNLRLRPAWDARPGQNPAISFSCERTSVIDRSRSKPRNTGNEWMLTVVNWTVEPNALFATLRYLVDHPQLRSSVTAAQIAAMLTPPAKSERGIQP